MRTLAITGIGELTTNDAVRFGGDLGILRDAALVVEDGRIAWIGPTTRAPATDRRLDVDGRAVIPGLVDAHTHLVFAGDRSQEFVARMAGSAYDGRGILETVEATRAASTAHLSTRLRHSMAELRHQGTTTVEIKSGYGLDLANETRLLRIAGAFTSETTFLGGHAIPVEYRRHRDAYIELVSGDMLRVCAPLARWADVFCEPHSPHALREDEARLVLTRAKDAGLGVRVHGCQLGEGPGAELAVELGAASLDHATHLRDSDVDLLADAAPEGGPVVTLLPLVEFATRQPFPDARRLLDRGVHVALASDCNPGTNASSSLPLAMALAVRHMGMTPEQALRGATVEAARSLRRDDIGRLTVGAAADLALVDAPSYLHIFYRPGVPLVSALDVADTPGGGSSSGTWH